MIVIIALIMLVILLVTQELVIVGNSEFTPRITKFLNVLIVPLLILYLVTVALNIKEIITGFTP